MTGSANPAFPAQWFNAYSVLSPGEPGFVATVARAPERELDTSVGVSGPHAFAVLYFGKTEGFLRKGLDKPQSGDMRRQGDLPVESSADWLAFNFVVPLAPSGPRSSESGLPPRIQPIRSCCATPEPRRSGHQKSFPAGRNSPMNDEPYKSWQCRTCGYIYDEEKGDPDEGLAPGTRWAEIPDDWVCPECGTAKSDFDMVEA
jgi:rubredoxin